MERGVALGERQPVYRRSMKTADREPTHLPATAAVTVPDGGLTLRRVAIDTYHENVAYLHRDCAVVRAEGFQALSKVEVRANGKIGRASCRERV